MRRLILLCGEQDVYLPQNMRRINTYIYQLPAWPAFEWDHDKLSKLLAETHHRRGKLLGRMEELGFSLQTEASLQMLTLDVLKSSEIEGEVLPADQVRSSIARRLGIKIAGLVPADRNVEGIVEMMLDATQHYPKQLTDKRLFAWHASLFTAGHSGMHKIVTGAWRNNTKDDPMQVVSGAMGHEKVHFEAPASEKLATEMKKFLKWFNNEIKTDPVIKAAIAHLWFVTIHPFDDGNGRIARAIADMQFVRADSSAQRFYSMSSQIRLERKEYYTILEKTQKGNLDITAWLEWFLKCLSSALSATNKTLVLVLSKARFWKNHAATSFNDRQKKMLNKILDGFDGKLTSTKWAKITKCSQDSAGRDINDLIERGILIKESAGGRSSSYALSKNA